MPMKELTHREIETPPQTPVRAAVSINQTKLLELTHRLTERVKELNCHFGISHLFEDEKLSVDDILQGVINILPPAWQYPQITCVRIKCRRGEFKTANFKETPWRQSQNIIVDGKLFGTIEVYYLESRPEMDEGPFLKEERNLIYIIAERLGHMIDRQIAARNVKFLYQRERELRKKLQSEMRVRVDFTRKLIHELKTPLTALIATSQLLYDEIENQKLGKLAGYIMDSANNLNVRIEELHDVVRGETGILKINPQIISLAALLQSLLEETRALCRQSGMQIELHIDPDLPEVYADPDRIRQVVLNLINNALKYARSGQRIRIAATRQPDAVQVEVQDFGPGIARERQTTIFEPGYQQSQAEERSGGLGIGLALCKMLIERHGGRIWIKSQPGQGANFFFTIPIKDARSIHEGRNY
jgi:signal transduction histidine kinase